MKQVVIKILKKILDKKDLKLKNEEIEKLIEIPPSYELGDYAFPCFALAEKLKMSPEQIALEIRADIGNPPMGFQDVQTSGPYINFFLDRENMSRKIVSEILSKKENFGKTDFGKGKKAIIEFSQPNTHKAFHVGHVRGTSLGESLARIFEFHKKKVIRANYSGDTGMHVAKWMWCYQKYHSKEKLKQDESWIASIYVDAVKRLSKNSKLQQEVDSINKKLSLMEDKELNLLWKKTRNISIDSWKKIYKELNTYFDVHFFESEMEKPGINIVDELLVKKIAKTSDDAVIVDLKKYNLGCWVLLRKDGTPLYSTKDLALAKKKLNSFKIDESVYVVGAEQKLYLLQLFKTLELMKYDINKLKAVHFSEVRLSTGKMSSRTGENILYSDFIKEIEIYAKKQIKKREPKISVQELESRAVKISVAALKYSMLKQTPSRPIMFEKEKELNFEGDTGPYLLYSYARACSILKKSKSEIKKFEILNLEQKEIDLVKKLSEFKDVVIKAYETLNPSLIAVYSYNLAKIFNEFYHACPVIGSKQMDFRLALVNSFKYVLESSLNLLGIEVLERM